MTKNKITLIIGNGEIGSSLGKVLKKKYIVRFVDVEPIDPVWNPKTETVDVMHICFPPIKNFVEAVKAYQRLYKPRYTVIHSTVALGTSKKCKAYHSPVRGVHPNIDKALTVFTKYLAPNSDYLKRYFEAVDIPIRLINNSNTTEALKIWDTTIYGVNIMLEKEIYDWCKKHKVDYDMVYPHSALTYNMGYENMGLPQYKKYILKHVPGKIGGHCVIQNLALLDSPLANELKKRNQNY